MAKSTYDYEAMSVSDAADYLAREYLLNAHDLELWLRDQSVTGRVLTREFTKLVKNYLYIMPYMVATPGNYPVDVPELRI